MHLHLILSPFSGPEEKVAHFRATLSRFVPMGEGVIYLTIVQQQCLLRYLGFYTGSIDGSFGPASAAATAAFQRTAGLEADGIFGPRTEKAILAALTGPAEEDFWDELQFFRRQEFACRCGKCGGFPAEPAENLLREAEALRARFGACVTVTSGVRCAQHNAAVGGVANSRHLTGKAMDFSVAGQGAAAILDWLRSRSAIRYAYAIDERHVHMDVA